MKLLSTIFMAIGAMVALSHDSAAQSWQGVGPLAGLVSPSGVFTPAIEFSPSNELHVSYQDFAAGSHQASIQKFVSGSWQLVGAQGGASLGDAWYNRLAFTSSGDCFIAHRDYAATPGGALGVYKFASGGSAWTSVGSSSPSLDEAHYTDITTHTSGDPVVIYADRSTTPADRTTVQRYASGQWFVLGGVGFTDAAAYQTIECNAAGVLYCGFTSGANGKGSVMQYNRILDTWSNVGSAEFTPDTASNMQLRLDNNGVPHVAYHRWHSGIVVMKWTGSAWTQVGPDASGGDTPEVETEGWRQWMSLRFDSNSKPYVAYQLLSNGKCCVRRFESGTNSWDLVGASAFSPYRADYLVMALSSADVPYVAFRDSRTGKLMVMGYF